MLNTVSWGGVTWARSRFVAKAFRFGDLLGERSGSVSQRVSLRWHRTKIDLNRREPTKEYENGKILVPRRLREKPPSLLGSQSRPKESLPPSPFSFSRVFLERVSKLARRAGGRERTGAQRGSRVGVVGPPRRARRRQPPQGLFADHPRGPRHTVFARWGGWGLFADRTRQKLMLERAPRNVARFAFKTTEVTFASVISIA